jgi:hypothetical protein
MSGGDCAAPAGLDIHLKRCGDGVVANLPGRRFMRIFVLSICVVSGVWGITPVTAQDCRSLNAGEARCEIQTNQPGRWRIDGISRHASEHRDRMMSATTEILVNGARCGPVQSIQCDNCTPSVPASCTISLGPGLHVVRVLATNSLARALDTSASVAPSDPGAHFAVPPRTN